MTSALALGLLWTGQTAYSATFADVWDRWKRVDAAWSLGDSKPRQAQSIPHLKAATGQIYAARWSEACESLDTATALLEGRTAEPEMAVSLRFRPPVAEPGKPARLIVSWAYRPSGVKEFPLVIGNRRIVLHPGRNLTIDVRPGQLEPELTRNPELGVPLTAAVGSSSRTIVLSILKSPRTRIAKLLNHEFEAVRNLGQKALAMMEAPVPAEPASSLLTTISVAESLAKGDVKLSTIRSLPYARQGSTGLQISRPAELALDAAGKATVVVGVSGFGGEAGFFESHGQGSAPDEASRRGWIFVGATPSESAVRDALDWIQSKMQVKVGRYYTLGFGTGAGSALGAAELKPKPEACGLFSPAHAAVPRSWTEGPLYLAVGRLDAPRFVNAVQAMARELSGKSNFKLDEIEGAEHLMVPNEAVAQAFAFFDARPGTIPHR